MNPIHRLSAIAIFEVILAPFAVVPEKALADVLQCASRSLHPDDERRLIASAGALLPPDAEPFVAHPCGNPSSAQAEILTAHVKVATGVIHWWELACQRGSAEWKCDPAVLKQFIDTRLLVGGKPRRVELSFDKDTTLNRAKRLSSRALTLFADPASRLPRCKTGAGNESAAADLHWSGKLPAGTKPIHVSVSHDEGAAAVWLEDVSVDIDFPASEDDATNSRALCWNKIVLVT